MGFRLRILSWWTPVWLQGKALDELAHSTINGLEKILNEYSPLENNAQGRKYDINEKIILKGNLDEKRRIMTTTHNELVETLISILGREEAILKGRKAMYNEGLLLGQRFKWLLGVGDDLQDLITAARIMYQVLGIDFVVEEKGQNEMIMRVNHCSLAHYYDLNTCKVLSAVDEGVVQGLNPDIQMMFTERITQGHDHCLASLKMILPMEE
ncbi:MULTISPECIES: L-2-amino-thiazoline-4-carboxylic acid hydrolase [Methanobacterium]|jgi:hypothetical protein|uniref:L-2-amino-thiazoline-4-carboxylic acid hydrolase n=1 Tax=Methanobacterium subterraneum TaxID=59277 RepID=A0A2H4VBM8_9EURY|nr:MULTISPECIES: L-2-amino-thiazoline-4-carboxylic acid hydrolase [Methanobacterium]MBW4258438.1 L-2-amino-thiazoline-4-carboxylic acid hydrolase [Methanobacterium sp. YSL]PKL71879.1 MAG: hypothetical protein CVV29_08330 [Methanobacteriales archaeon HGW-Methanobacteriales-2]AUB55507.1 hypothetical protein BK007_05405 [Methanobacterium subterraneum]MCC7559510.1 L-2-amino-thiazoline-4-carboxylic acid hydrolase [Methanobacterium sp.]NMO08342.1 L-2-amino-thiazoline-4-carboxylic acid hydrolase [Met